MGKRVKQDITDMLISGKSPGAIKKALQGDLNMNYYAADRLVRTEANHYYNDAAMKSYKAAGVKMCIRDRVYILAIYYIELVHGSQLLF